MTATEEVKQDNLQLVIASSNAEPGDQRAVQVAMHPFWVQVAEWEGKVDGVSDPKIARQSRLLLRKIRIEATHKKDELKAGLLARTRAIDGAYRLIADTLGGMESKLDEVEKAAERAEAARKAALKAERDAALRQYGMDTTYIQTGEMTDDAFLGLLNQAKQAHAAKIEAARKAEEERIAAEKKAAEERAAREKAEAEERARIAAENERLRREAAEREKAAAAERLRVEAERKAAEEKARKEREAVEAKAAEERRVAAEAARVAAEKARKEREALELKAKAEREAREKAEAEIRRQKEATEAKARAEEEERKRLEAAPDVEKVRVYLAAVRATPIPHVSAAAVQDALIAFARRLEVAVGAAEKELAKLEAAQ